MLSVDKQLQVECQVPLWPSQRDPLLGQSLPEGEPGPPTTLVQARVTEAEKQMLYEIERTAEEKKKSFLSNT